MDTGITVSHVRDQRSLLAAVEKQLLVWLAQRMPPFVNSDHLTLLGFCGIILSGASFWAAGRHPAVLLLVVAGLALNWFGDSLDGTLARVRNAQRPRYGYYTDHVLDLIGAAVLLSGMAMSGYMSLLVGLALLTAYVMVMAETFLSTHVLKVFRMSFMRFGPTELRILLAAGALYLMYRPVVRLPWVGSVLLFDAGGIVAIAGLSVTLVVSALRNIRTLYREESIPGSRP